MDSKFASAYFLSDWKVYGYRLKPFCLLHSMQIEALPLQLHTWQGVLAAARVCSTYKVHTSHKLPLWRCVWFNHDKEKAKFEAYLDESKSSPDLYEPEEGSSGRGSLRSTWQQIIVTYLRRKTGISRREAWTMPQGQAIWDFYSVREQESGQSDIYSEEEQIEDAELKERLASDESKQQIAEFTEYMRRRREKTWPKGLIFSHGMEFPPEPPKPQEEV